MPKFKLAWLDRLIRRHSGELKAFALQRAGSETAEDLVQEAYLRLMQHPEPESIDNARAFLYQTVANLSIDQHRRQSVRERFLADHGESEAEMLSIAASGPSQEDQLASQQQLDRLNHLLLELPAATRNAFVLYRLEGLAHKEISLRLGISERSSVRLVAAAAHHLMLGFGAFQSE